jgi:hypothetical protein
MSHAFPTQEEIEKNLENNKYIRHVDAKLKRLIAISVAGQTLNDGEVYNRVWCLIKNYYITHYENDSPNSIGLEFICTVYQSGKKV